MSTTDVSDIPPLMWKRGATTEHLLRLACFSVARRSGAEGQETNRIRAALSHKCALIRVRRDAPRFGRGRDCSLAECLLRMARIYAQRFGKLRTPVDTDADGCLTRAIDLPVHSPSWRSAKTESRAQHSKVRRATKIPFRNCLSRSDTPKYTIAGARCGRGGWAGRWGKNRKIPTAKKEKRQRSVAGIDNLELSRSAHPRISDWGAASGYLEKKLISFKTRLIQKILTKTPIFITLLYLMYPINPGFIQIETVPVAVRESKVRRKAGPSVETGAVIECGTGILIENVVSGSSERGTSELICQTSREGRGGRSLPQKSPGRCPRELADDTRPYLCVGVIILIRGLQHSSETKESISGSGYGVIFHNKLFDIRAGVRGAPAAAAGGANIAFMLIPRGKHTRTTRPRPPRPPSPRSRPRTALKSESGCSREAPGDERHRARAPRPIHGQ
ncbi:hypothetical protein EVAR_98467_1 [Eumeta japonica]|uniref:Uncharacterized protein n=1 Tax=Eumeta variegata TaxID=151549 RepID=A0A4C1YS15_EUMVA|nr:hypothetical protein EVAR_98467_1 [Eumeta japonica]